MPRASKPLTATTIKNITKPGKYYDRDGLMLVVTSAETKRWVQRISVNGKRTDIGLGSAKFVSLAEARAEALENKKIAQASGDPRESKKRKVIPTFSEAFEEVFRIKQPSWRNRKHGQQFRNTMETYVLPKIGRQNISEISVAGVLAVLEPIWLTKAETARRVKQRISSVFMWAVANGYRPDDPTAHLSLVLPRQTAQTQHMLSLPYDQVADFLSKLRLSKAMASTKLAIEFVILTAARSGEVRHATWSEINFEDRKWTIPATRMKAGEEHVVPLSERCMALLEEAQKLSDCSLIFSGMRPNQPMSDMTMSKLVKKLGYNVTIHGFRTTFRIWAQEQTNTPTEVAEKALAHKLQNKVMAAYARSDLFEKRRELMDAWAEYVAFEGT